MKFYYTINEIYAKIAGNFKPDIIKREVVDENKRD